jgi:hypothetical protein
VTANTALVVVVLRSVTLTSLMEIVGGDQFTVVTLSRVVGGSRRFEIRPWWRRYDAPGTGGAPAVI